MIRPSISRRRDANLAEEASAATRAGRLRITVSRWCRNGIEVQAQLSANFNVVSERPPPRSSRAAAGTREAGHRRRRERIREVWPAAARIPKLMETLDGAIELIEHRRAEPVHPIRALNSGNREPAAIQDAQVAGYRRVADAELVVQHVGDLRRTVLAVRKDLDDPVAHRFGRAKTSIAAP
jgi:hypothetical protein